MLENGMVINAEREWNALYEVEAVAFEEIDRWDIARYVDERELDLKAVAEGLGFDGEEYMDVDEMSMVKGLLEQHNRERLHTYYVDYLVRHNMETDVEQWYKEVYGE